MELIISLLMGTRLLALFGGGLAGESAPLFLEPRIVITAHDIRLSCVLQNAFPGELRKLAQTGTPVVVYSFMTVSDGQTRRQVASVTVEQRLVYDVITKRFCVSRSAPRDTICSENLDSAIALVSAFRSIPVLSKQGIRTDRRYVFSAQAVLGKTRVEALDNREIDCMYYWNYKRPTMRTGEIAGERLMNAGGGGITE